MIKDAKEGWAWRGDCEWADVVNLAIGLSS